MDPTKAATTALAELGPVVITNDDLQIFTGRELLAGLHGAMHRIKILKNFLLYPRNESQEF